ncbi:hypothetical protein GCM10010517_44260 [Streptosporangium fragile]|uniref:Uncharacterized protein n=1 Tax=Streptosporangium fragile TaxID=46186 RepID=A0ABN3W0G0_9ACTN
MAENSTDTAAGVDVKHPGKVSGILGPARRICQPACQSCGALASEQVRGISVGFSGTPSVAAATAPEAIGVIVPAEVAAGPVVAAAGTAR